MFFGTFSLLPLLKQHAESHSIHYPSKDQFEFKIPKFYTEYSVKSLCKLPTSSERIGKGIGNSSDSRTSPPRKAFETNECQE